MRLLRKHETACDKTQHKKEQMCHEHKRAHAGFPTTIENRVNSDSGSRRIHNGIVNCL